MVCDLYVPIVVATLDSAGNLPWVNDHQGWNRARAHFTALPGPEWLSLRSNPRILDSVRALPG
jgi:hypothetical protein